MIKQRELYQPSDIRMYLTGCIVGWRLSSGKIKAYRVEEVEGNTVFLRRNGSKDVDFRDERLILDWPTLGVVQTGIFVTYVMTDSFDRQYKKAINNRSLVKTVVMEREVRALRLETGAISLDDYTGMYNVVDKTLTEALHMLQNMLAVRINRDFFITKKSGYLNPMLGYRDVLVGEVCDGVVELFPSYKTLEKRVASLATVSMKELA
tara:strand:+ start:36 stop:656 length:621 start_codon:yes stop_codon:yes gene_type:complete